MSKKLILVFTCVVFFFSFRFAFASLVIDEIMYAPASGSDNEWVEIFNGGDSQIDLNDYRFFHGTSESSSSSGPLTLRNGSTTILQPSEYAIIAKSLTDYSWLNFSGMILSASTLSLPDSGDNTYIAISDPDKVIIDSVKYDTSLGGSKDSGNSLQLVNGAWVGATPTPGSANSGAVSQTANSSADTPSTPDNSSVSLSNSGGGGSYSTSATTSNTKSKTTEVQKIKTQITSKTLGFIGIPLSLQAKTSGTKGEQLFSGEYFWNFGDGDSKEENLVGNQPISHTYFYPGDYVVSLDYYQTYFSDTSTPDASSQITIKIIPTDVSISKVGDEKDFFIELTNNTNYSADLSGWIILGDQKIFKIPKNTIVSSKQKMLISPKITNFSVVDKNSLKLLNPQGYVIFDYSSPNTIAIVDKPTDVGRLDASRRPTSVTASAIASDIVGDEPMIGSNSLGDSSSSSKIMFSVLSFVFIGVAACAVYFIRRKKIILPQAGNDFEILEE